MPGDWVVVEFSVEDDNVGVLPSVFVGIIMYVHCVSFAEAVGGVLLECLKAIISCGQWAAQGGEDGLFYLFLCHCFRGF